MLTLTQLPAAVRSLSPSWLGAAAAAAAAGAALMPGRRVVAGAALGLGVLALALWQSSSSGPCCSGCADAAAAAGAAADDARAPMPSAPATWHELMTGVAPVTAAGASSCGGVS